MSTSLNLFFRKPLLIACLAAGGLAACSGESDGAAGSVSGRLADAERNAGNARIIGTIEGAVGDQSGPWHALSMTHQGETVSTASWSAVMGDLISYSIQGHEGDSFSVANSISVDLTLSGGRSYDPTVAWFPEASLAPNYMSVEDSVTVTFDSMEENGDEVRVSGTAKGEVFLHASMMGEPDMSDSRPVDLRFEAVLSKLE